MGRSSSVNIGRKDLHIKRKRSCISKWWAIIIEVGWALAQQCLSFLSCLLDQGPTYADQGYRPPFTEALRSIIDSSGSREQVGGR